MHYSRDFVAASHDHGPYQFHPAVNVTSHASCESSWSAIDPSLSHFQQDDYGRPATGLLASQKESTDYHPTHADSTHYNSFPVSHEFHQLRQPDWPFDAARIVRYDSPGGPHGGTLSESSSEYPMSPENTRLSATYSSSPSEQSFQFAPLPGDAHYCQQSLWSMNSSFMPLPTPPIEANPHTQAIAMKEVEFQASPDYNVDPNVHDDSTFTIKIALPMQTPEELELSEDIATPAASSRANTFSSRSTEHDMSENDYSVRDHDSDSDFNPNRRQPGRHLAGGHAAGRNTSNLRQPRRVSASMAHPGMPPTRVTKPVRQGRNPAQKEKSRPKPPFSKRTGSIHSPTTDKAPKSFPCTFHAFGCASKFANKNEWKRHVMSQHLQLGFFRCDLGGCNPENDPRLISSISSGQSPTELERVKDNDDEEEREITFNDFNRKDLFTQHCRRMHGPLRHNTDNTTLTNQRINERARKMQLTSTSKSKVKMSVAKEDEAAFEVELDAIRARCWTVRRKAPARSVCGFCGRLFQADIRNGEGNADDMDSEDGKAEERAWEERMEHIGKHYEKDGCSPELESTDDDLRDWGLHEGILERIPDQYGMERVWLVGYEHPSVGDEIAKLRSEEEEVLGSREVQRRTGLRKRPAGNVTQHRHGVSNKVAWPPAPFKAEASDSEMDADAEVE